MHSKEFVEKMKERLLEEKERLSDELNELSAHTEMGDEDDENAQEVVADEVSQDIAATLKADLEKIEAALKRIEDGSYGVAADGQDIPEARLEALPWADSLIE